jgi:hypothetical protein
MTTWFWSPFQQSELRNATSAHFDQCIAIQNLVAKWFINEICVFINNS